MGKRRGTGPTDEIRALVERAGARLTIGLPSGGTMEVGERPTAALVRFGDGAAVSALLEKDHLALAEAYLDRRIDVEGSWAEVMKVSEIIEIGPTIRERVTAFLRLVLRDRRRYQRESIAFHYDRPFAFFQPWLDRWRSYSHGFYSTPQDSIERAQERKLAHAVDALELRSGMHVLDMGCGWGSFLEYAGRLGVHVHGITISREQFRFVERLIHDRRLPCSVEFVDLLDFTPDRAFDGAVFMGTFEHMSDYRWVARFLSRHLRPEARLYTDFCTTRSSHQVGAFMARHIWPGTATYVDLPRLTRALLHAGFNLFELTDDTLSYALTVRDWADSLEAAAAKLSEEWGERSVRAFILFLRGSEYFLATNRTQAYHLVAARHPRALAHPAG